MRESFFEVELPSSFKGRHWLLRGQAPQVVGRGRFCESQFTSFDRRQTAHFICQDLRPVRSLIRLTELRQFGGAADTTLGINVGPIVDVFLADARSDYTFVEACKKRRTATVISAITERRHSQSVVQGFESPGCGQNE